jgi:hypothetical protein
MSEELTGQQANPQSNEQSAQTTKSDDNVDYKSLYLEEVNNAKKLRKRAQESESKISEFVKAQETDKVRQLKDQEKFKELSESLQSKLDEVSPFRDKWENYEANKRESLLSKLPKEDRESLAQESLKTLEYIVSLQSSTKPESPKHTPGASRTVKEPELPSDWATKMTHQEKQDNWSNILSQYGIKNINKR